MLRRSGLACGTQRRATSSGTGAAAASCSVLRHNVPTLSQQLPAPSSSSSSLAQQQQRHHRRHADLGAHLIVASTPETEEARSPLDAPQEWEPPMPSRRPDIFPEFEKVERVILPKPLPGDPEMPDEEMEEAAKRTTPGDPDPEQKPGEAPEPEPAPPQPDAPPQPGQEPERKTDIPNIPE